MDFNMQKYIAKIKKLNHKKIALWSLIGVFGIALLLMMFDKVIMPLYVRSNVTESVPSVVGMKLDDANTYLKKAGFNPHKTDERFDRRYPKGTVMLQNPPPEAVVKPGRRVYLVVSSGEQVVEVPSIRWRSLREASFTLERMGLQMGNITYELSSLHPENTIIEQGVEPGDELPRGSAINVIVSQGGEADNVMVPELVGKSFSDAQRLLNQRGLRIGNVTYQPIPDLLPKTVVQQYPHPGDRIPRTQPVDLFIAEEPPKDAEKIREGVNRIEE
jgi:eukaryotic-like serine/threonine-protein kinase